MESIAYVRLIIGLGWIIMGISYVYQKKRNPDKYKNPGVIGIFWLLMGVSYVTLLFY